MPTTDRKPPLLTFLKWFGTALGVCGALVIALNIPISGWGFVAFLISSVSWTIAGVLMKEPSIVILQVTFTAVNLIGIYRWLIA